MPVIEEHGLALIATESDDSSLRGGGKLIFPLEMHCKDLWSVRRGKGFLVGMFIFEGCPYSNGRRSPLSGIQSESGLWNWRIFLSIFYSHGLPSFGLCADYANFTYVLPNIGLLVM
jgi:hypothetical protein